MTNKTEEEIRLDEEIRGYNTKQKVKDNDEVFTPDYLVNEMLDKLDPSVWKDPKKTWFDPCVGIGQFPVQILKRLMIGLEDWEPNEAKRKRHILENMIFMNEMNPESVAKVQRVLNPHGFYKLNIECGDFFKYGEKKVNKLF